MCSDSQLFLLHRMSSCVFYIYASFEKTNKQKHVQNKSVNFAQRLRLNLSSESAKSASSFLRHSRHVSQSAEVVVGSRGVQLFLTFAESVLPACWNEVRNCVTACCLHVCPPASPHQKTSLQLHLLAFLHVKTHNHRFFNNNRVGR